MIRHGLELSAGWGWGSLCDPLKRSEPGRPMRLPLTPAAADRTTYRYTHALGRYGCMYGCMYVGAGAQADKVHTIRGSSST